MDCCLSASNLVQEVAVPLGAGRYQRHGRLTTLLSDEICVSFAVFENQTFLGAGALMAHNTISVKDRLDLPPESDPHAGRRSVTPGLRQGHCRECGKGGCRCN